ncbi:MAG: mechanosensitive ion channel, partial [Chitinispirillales bacterium]|nr:mechanosensitive ion channel [Chitinispirillales bacterium]
MPVANNANEAYPMINTASTHIRAALLFLLLSFPPLFAQEEGDSAAKPVDSAESHPSDQTSAQQHAQAIVPDSIAYRNNYRAIDLINRYREDSLASAIKTSFLTAQIASSDSLHRHALLSQLKKQLADDSARLSAHRLEIDSVKALSLPASAALRGDAFITLYVPTGSLNPAERASLYSGRVAQAAKKFSAKFDTLSIVDNGLSADIVFNDATLINITDMDAYWVGAGRDEFALAEKERLHAALVSYDKNLGLWNILKMVGLSLAVIIALIAAIKFVGHLFSAVIDRKMVDNREKWFKGVRIRNVEILTSAKLLSAALFVSKILRFAIYAVLLYAAFPMLFAIFPATRHLAGVLFSWIATPLVSMGEGFVAYLPKLLRIIVIILLMRYLLKLLRYIATEIETGRLLIPKFYPDWARATFNLLRIFIYAFTIVLIFPLLPESESMVFKGVSVFIGVLFSIGSSSVISNMMAGMVITYMRSFKIGDRIKVGDVYGDVVEKTLFVIRVQTVKKEIVTVPNSTILASNVINYSIAAGDGGNGVVITLDVDIGYDVVWERAHKLLIEAAQKTEHVQENPKPFVLTKALGDYAATYMLGVYTKRPEL